MLLPIISDFTGNGNFGEKKGGPAGCLLPADMKKKYFKKIVISFMVLLYRTVVTIICLKNEKFVNGLCKKMKGGRKEGISEKKESQKRNDDSGF